MITRRVFSAGIGAAAALVNRAFAAPVEPPIAMPTPDSFAKTGRLLWEAQMDAWMDTIRSNLEVLAVPDDYRPKLMELNRAILETDPRWAGSPWPGYADVNRILPLPPIADIDIETVEWGWQGQPQAVAGLRCQRAVLNAFDPRAELHTPPDAAYTPFLLGCGSVTPFDSYVDTVIDRVRSGVWRLDAYKAFGSDLRFFVPIDVLVTKDGGGHYYASFRSVFDVGTVHTIPAMEHSIIAGSMHFR